MIPQSLSLGPVTFNLYGLLVGVAVVTAWQLILLRTQRDQYCIDQLYLLGWWVLVCGVVGARIYHLITDWQLYQADPVQVLAIWNGGMSIIGGVLGGSLAVVWWARQRRESIGFLLDLAVFGLPIGQAIGRFGNFVNQELYGQPSGLPWAITIDPQFRIPGYEQFERFHPLFAYEAVLMLLFAGWVWSRPWKPGSGKIFAWYVWYYSIVRFGLDFLRIDKQHVADSAIGLNQVILVVIWLLVSSWLVWYSQQRKSKQHAI